jgi:2-hydroxychromene-2-carboxylate isomerase
MKPTVDFFLFYGSIYTYLAVMRVEKLAASAGLGLRWRPFNLREILVEHNNTAFVRNAVRMRYCWRDVERRAARHGIEYAEQPPYPVDPELLALRVGTIAAMEGWCPEYSKATYRSWFIDKKVPGIEPNVTDVLASLRKPAGDIIARAGGAEIAKQLKDNTEAARALGIFGAPTFAIGREIFWGDDRLEEALEFASRGR